jgi:hypothetical protein
MTALPIGKDNFAVQGFYSSTDIKVAGSSFTQFGPRIIYGLTNDLDISGKLAVGSLAGTSASTIGIGAKYTLMRVMNGDPFDLAGVVNIDSYSSSGYAAGSIGAGVEISKYLRNNFSAYGLMNLLQYSTKYSGTSSSSDMSLQWGGGVKYFINKKFSLFGEVSMYYAGTEGYTTFAVAMQYII